MEKSCDRQENVVVDGSLPGSDEVMFLRFLSSRHILVVLNTVP